MAKVFIHAGFHKTGTTTAQRAVAEHRRTLEPHVQIYLRNDMLDLTEAARQYSVTPTADGLAVFERTARALFSKCDANDSRPIALLSEDLAGQLPGRQGVKDYSAAVPLMQTLTRAAREVLATEDITVYFSTRDPASWLRSAHWQVIRYSRQSISLKNFEIDHRPATKFKALCKDINAAIAPARLVTKDLSHLKALPLGPLGPLLTMLDVPDNLRKRIGPPKLLANASQPALRGTFLALNRSSFDDQTVEEMKQQLIEKAHTASLSRTKTPADKTTPKHDREQAKKAKA